jgi:hypothetical protein
VSQAALAITTPCPVARLARDAVRTIVALRAADDMRRGPTLDAMADRLAFLEGACTHERATSPLGTFFQALVLSSELDVEANWVVPGADLKIGQLRRLVASIASSIDCGVDRSTAEVLQSYYHTDDLAEVEDWISAANSN